MKRFALVCLLALACSRGSAPAHVDASAPVRKLGTESTAWDMTLGVGDTNVRFSRPVFDASGSPVDLTGATIQFRYRLINQSSPSVTNAGTVTGSAPPWEATYTFTGADTAVAGDYHGQFLITLPRPDGGVDGSQETFTWPSSRLLGFSIQALP